MGESYRVTLCPGGIMSVFPDFGRIARRQQTANVSRRTSVIFMVVYTMKTLL